MDCISGSAEGDCIKPCFPPLVSQIHTKSNPGWIRYASDIDPTLADPIQGINGVIGFTMSTSQSELWCTHADLT